MHTLFKSILATGALTFAVALPSAHAQLTISGSTHGVFLDPLLLHTTVTNGPVVSLFSTGVPYRPAKPHFDTPTSLQFTGSTFVGADSGDSIPLGTVKIKNGTTLLGTAATAAKMDLFLNIPSESLWNFKLTSLLFNIINTPDGNVKGGVPDIYFIGHTAVNSLKLPDMLVNFDFHLTNDAFSTGQGGKIAEGKTGSVGLFALIAITPVPEASTYALWGAALLVGLVALRRIRSEKLAA